jgi:translation initiation factor IF-2
MQSLWILMCPGNARQLADKEEIDIRYYSIIYAAIDDLKDAMEGMLAPER